MVSVIKEISQIVSAYFNHGYPPFIYHHSDIDSYLPVFYYHNISVPEFEEHLIYLRENFYSTVTLDEAIMIIESKNRLRKEVVLTFDDGLENYYYHIFPLLLKYNMKAVFYTVPAWVDTPGFLTWEQCREMYNSGLVDFQSHSYSHSKIITKVEIKYIKENKDKNNLLWNIAGIEIDYILKDFKYLLVFEGSSLFKASFGYDLPIEFWEKCIEIKNQIDYPYIKKVISKRIMKNKYNKILKIYSQEIKNLGNNEIFQKMINDLNKSKNMIEKKIEGQKVNHFAFPWHENSELSWHALKEAGFLSGAIGLDIPNFHRVHTHPVYKICRVNGDFLYCLPGNRCKTFKQILYRKVKRRINN